MLCPVCERNITIKFKINLNVLGGIFRKKTIFACMWCLKRIRKQINYEKNETTEKHRKIYKKIIKEIKMRKVQLRKNFRKNEQ